MQDCQQQDWGCSLGGVASARGPFGEALQQVEVGRFRVERRVFEQLAKLVDDDEETSTRSLFNSRCRPLVKRDDLCFVDRLCLERLFGIIGQATQSCLLFFVQSAGKGRQCLRQTP